MVVVSRFKALQINSVPTQNNTLGFGELLEQPSLQTQKKKRAVSGAIHPVSPSRQQD